MKYSHEDLKQIGLSCLNLSLRRTCRLVTSYYDSMLKPSGLRITQFTVLAGIEYGKDLSITDLSRVTDIDRTTLQRSLEILNRDGLINIEKKEIGNVRSLTLTKKGESKLAQAIEFWRLAQKTMIDELGKSAFKLTLNSLTELRELPVLQVGFETE